MGRKISLARRDFSFCIATSSVAIINPQQAQNDIVRITLAVPTQVLIGSHALRKSSVDTHRFICQQNKCNHGSLVICLDQISLESRRI